MTETERGKIKHLRVYETGRNSDQPPRKAPYEFGVDKEWLERAKRLNLYPASRHRSFFKTDDLETGQASSSANSYDHREYR